MTFVSIDWLFWIAATVALYWLAPAGWRDRVLIALTTAFMIVHAPISACLLMALSGGVYGLTSVRPLPGWRALAAGSLIAMVLVAFKWNADLTVDTLARDIAIPLGLAYYSIRLFLYIIDSYVGTLPRHSFEQYLSYLFFLPTIVIGPIHRLHHFLEDYRYKRWDARQLSEGMQRIVYGYAKIVVLGNFVISGVFANFVGSIGPDYLALRQYLEIVRQGFNLYFQFSGFSDIAIGFGLLLGYRVMDNFHWPFLQKNIGDFWRCWHISLTSFARDHVYRVIFSLTRNRYLGVIGSMVFIALWHELSIRYLLWAVYHAGGIIVWQLSSTYLSPRLPSIETRYSRASSMR